VGDIGEGEGRGRSEGGTGLVDGRNFIHGQELGNDGDLLADVGIGVVDEGFDDGAEVRVGTDPWN